MITFCTTGDFLIHIPIPEGHAGAAAIAAEMKTADVRITNLETTVTEIRFVWPIWWEEMVPLHFPSRLAVTTRCIRSLPSSLA